MTDDKPRYRVAQGINQQGPGMICLLDNDVFIAEFNNRKTADRFARMGNNYDAVVEGLNRACEAFTHNHCIDWGELEEIVAKAKGGV